MNATKLNKALLFMQDINLLLALADAPPFDATSPKERDALLKACADNKTMGGIADAVAMAKGLAPVTEKTNRDLKG